MVRSLVLTLVLSAVSPFGLAQDSCATAQELEDTLREHAAETETIKDYCDKGGDDTYCARAFSTLESRYKNKPYNSSNYDVTLYEVSDTDCGTNISEAIRDYGSALRAALNIKSPAVDMNREIMDYIINPCYTQAIEALPKLDELTVEEGVALMKESDTKLVDKMITGFKTVIKPNMSFQQRKAHYEFAQRECAKRFVATFAASTD